MSVDEAPQQRRVQPLSAQPSVPGPPIEPILVWAPKASSLPVGFRPAFGPETWPSVQGEEDRPNKKRMPTQTKDAPQFRGNEQDPGPAKSMLPAPEGLSMPNWMRGVAAKGHRDIFMKPRTESDPGTGKWGLA